MKPRTTRLIAAVALAISTLVGIASAGPAAASAGPGDDRLLTAPASWWTYTGVTATQLGSLLSANKARLTDLQVLDPSVPTFTAVMVGNSGAYASGYWWYYGLTLDDVSSTLSSNTARLISVDPYATSSGTRYAVVEVPNSGAGAKSWWWYIGTTTALSSALNTNNARMIQVTPMPGSTTQYVAIMVSNAGSDALTWWWYVHESQAQVSSLLDSNHARLIDLSRNSDGSYDVVMYANPSTRWYWWQSTDLAGLLGLAAQEGERIIDVTPFVSGGTTTYTVLETRNTNALSEKLWNIIGPQVDSGNFGFYMKRVGGVELAGLEENRQYEPASALKVLYHAYSIHEESLGSAADSDSITYHYDPADPSNGGICPDNFSSTATTNLKNADQQMMWNSDNRMTRGIVDKYGKAAILNYGASLGLTATAINHDIGCPTPSTHNLTTLVDLGKVYAAYRNGTITSNATWKSQFASRMLNQSNYSGFSTSICPIVNQVAKSLGKSSATANAFCQAMTWIAKGGSYQYGGSLPYTVSWDGLSMTGVPFKKNGTITRRFFVFGEYVDGTTINSQAEADAINAARNEEYQEAMRPQIKAALATW